MNTVGSNPFLTYDGSTPAINGDPMSTEFDAQGRATKVKICSGSYRTPAEDDCLAPVSERAWSSPIYVDYGE